MRAALAAAERNHDLSAHGRRAAEESWKEFWRATRAVELTPTVEQLAGDIAGRHRLRGADAIHLASALTLGVEDLVVAVWDRRLHVAARAVGLAVSPAALPTS